MKTHYGLNPSFANWTSRLPLFTDPLRRGKLFEVFKEDGTPTGEPSPLSPLGWPVVDGRWHGVRLFGDMDGFMPSLGSWPQSLRLRTNGAQSAWVSWKGGEPDPRPQLTPAHGPWHLPSGEALLYFRPKALRTLDWGYQARKEKKPDWSKRRVLPSDPLQGEEMALELHCEAAGKLDATLWWNAPPRFELSVEDYEVRLEEMLTTLKRKCSRPPILEYGNELWNEGFPVRRCFGDGVGWHARAAFEIDILHRVAKKVFGDEEFLVKKPFYVFVGGCLADGGFTLDHILDALHFTPDLAGPALYATPQKADKDRWNQTGEIPSQDQLKESMLGNIPALRAKLDAHRAICQDHGVPHFAVYEAGQSLIANGKPWKKAALEAQRTEWMGGIYREIRKQMEGAGVSLCNWYSAASSQAPADARVDVFGLLEATLDKAEPLPKARAARGD